MGKNKPNRKEAPPADDLFRCFAEGDVEALELIYRAYYPRLKDYGIQLTGSHLEAEVHDIIQDFFIWMAKNYFKFEQIDDGEAYLFSSIRRNIFLSLGKAQSKDAKRKQFLNQADQIEDSIQDSPEEIFIQGESEANIRSLLLNRIHDLPTYQWETLYLRFYEGCSYRKIAQILSINEQVARNYTFRAIKKLRKRLEHLNNPFFMLIILFL